MRLEYFCERCGSTNVTSDTIARWDAAAQRWNIVGHYDSGECVDCGWETILDRLIAESVSEASV